MTYYSIVMQSLIILMTDRQLRSTKQAQSSLLRSGLLPSPAPSVLLQPSVPELRKDQGLAGGCTPRPLPTQANSCFLIALLLCHYIENNNIHTCLENIFIIIINIVVIVFTTLKHTYMLCTSLCYC